MVNLLFCYGVSVIVLGKGCKECCLLFWKDIVCDICFWLSVWGEVCVLEFFVNV